MTWIATKNVEGMIVRAKDGTEVGKVDILELDPKSWQVKAIRVEASRHVLEELNLDEPAVSGGRTVYIDTGRVARLDEEVHLLDDVYGLAELRWSKPPV